MDSRSLDGWLSKLSTTRSGSAMWQRRWFVLTGDRLCYYNSPGEASGEPKWTLELGVGGASASMHPPGDGSDAARFDLRAGDELVCFKADSEVEAEMWLCALETPQGGGSAAQLAAPATGGLFDGLAVPSMPPTSADSPSAAVSAFGFMGDLGLPAPTAAPSPQPAPGSAGTMHAPPASTGGGVDAAAAMRKKKVVRKAKQPGGFAEDAPSGESTPSTVPPPPPPPAPASAGASPASGLGGMFEGMDLGVPLPPAPPDLLVGAPTADALGLPVAETAAQPISGSHASAAAPQSLWASTVPGPSVSGFPTGGAHAMADPSSNSSSPYSDRSFAWSAGKDRRSAGTDTATPPHPLTGSAYAYPTPAAHDLTGSAHPHRPPPDARTRQPLYASGRASSSRSSSHGLSSECSAGAPNASAHAAATPDYAPAYASAAAYPVVPPGGTAADRRSKSKSGDRRAPLQAGGVGAIPVGGPAGGLGAIPVVGPPESLDVDVAVSGARAHVSRLQSEHASLCARQHELLRRQAAQAAELSALQSSRAAARAAQQEASAAEDYERAAALGAEIGAREGREAALAAGMAEEEAAYQEAEEDKAELLKGMAAVWEETVEACHRCLSAREAVATREAESRAAQLAKQSAAISAERQRLRDEAEALGAKQAQLTAKRDEAQRSIGEEARAPMAERAHWREQEENLEREIAALLEQVERKRAQQAEASRQATECSARIAAVEARFDKQLKKVEAKEQALAAAQQVHGRAAQGLETASAAHAAQLRSVDDERASRQGWVAAAQAAVGAAEEEVARQRATAAGAGRVVVAAQALLAHRTVEREALGDMESEVAACERVRRGQMEAVVEMEAEAELLARQLGAMQDQQVRLERDKRLAVAGQKFSAAARVASELKALAIKFESDTLARQRLLEQAETARSAQLDGERRLSDIESRLKAQQRHLDRRRLRLLQEHEDALRAALPAAEPAQAELLRSQLASSEASRQALRAQWGWDTEAHPTQAEAGVASAPLGVDESESDGSSHHSPSAHNGRHTNGPPAAAPLASLVPTSEAAEAIHAALDDSEESEDDSDSADGGGASGGTCQARGADAIHAALHDSEDSDSTDGGGGSGGHGSSAESNGAPSDPPEPGILFANMQLGPPAPAVGVDSNAQGLGIAGRGEGTGAAAGGVARVPDPPSPPQHSPTSLGFVSSPGDAATAKIPEGGRGGAAGPTAGDGGAVAPVSGADAGSGGSVVEPGSYAVGGSERDALRRLLDSKEDAMQAAVDRDDFESASQLQEEIDLITDRLEALG